MHHLNSQALHAALQVTPHATISFHDRLNISHVHIPFTLPACDFMRFPLSHALNNVKGRLRLKCDVTRAETRFRLSAKRTSPLKSAGASVQSTTGTRGVRISGSNAGYTMFRGSVKGTGYPLHSPVSPSLPLPCVTVCHHVSTGIYVLPAFLMGARPSVYMIQPLNGLSNFHETPRKYFNMLLTVHLSNVTSGSNLTFVFPCIIIYGLYSDQLDANCLVLYLLHYLLYMFRM